MINSNELMIGNILFWNGEPVSAGLLKVTSINEGSFTVNGIGTYCTPHESEYNDIEAINLTQRVLESMGFVKLDTENDIIVWGLDDNANGEEFSIISDGINHPTPLYFAYNLGYKEVRKEIKYVHQLQNLYYLLMGEELKINIIQP